MEEEKLEAQTDSATVSTNLYLMCTNRENGQKISQFKWLFNHIMVCLKFSEV